MQSPWYAMVVSYKHTYYAVCCVVCLLLLAESYHLSHNIYYVIMIYNTIIPYDMIQQLGRARTMTMSSPRG